MLGAVAALALANLGQPFIWDGAFFMLSAQKLAAGARLYRDVWDVKQPGLFWFFLEAGRVFRFDEVGARALDAAWMCSLALVMRATLAGAFVRPWFAGLAALLSVGYGYAFADGTHLGQVEWLVALPLFVSFWAALRARGSARAWAPWALAAGLAGGAVLVFKLALLPLVGTLWLVAFWPLCAGGANVAGAPARDWTAPRAVAALALACAAVAAVAAAVIARFASEGTLDLVRWTFLTLPPRILAGMHGVRIKPLGEAIGWFLPRWAPVLALAFAGATARGRDRWTAGMVAWLGMGLVVFLVQRFSYWPYHFMLFVVPLGVLAARGVEALEGAFAREAPGSRVGVRVAGIVALACLWAILSGAEKGVYLAHDRFLTTDAMVRRSHLRFSRNGVYGKVLAEVRFLSEPGARPGPIFVVGDPLFTWLSGRRQAGPRNPGMLFEFMQPDEWAACARDLAASHAAYVFVQDAFSLDRAPVSARSGAFRAELAAHWRATRTGAAGTWYEPRDAAVPATGDAAPPAPAGRP